MREGGEVGIRVLYRMGWDAWNKRKEVTSKRAIGLLCLLHYFYSEKCNRSNITCLPLPLYFAPVTLLPCSCYSPSLSLLLSLVYSNYHCQTELLNLVPFLLILPLAATLTFFVTTLPMVQLFIIIFRRRESEGVWLSSPIVPSDHTHTLTHIMDENIHGAKWAIV
ncbi:hypothetical protein F5H01DRAFT_348681 [Linnemannia elongata]|nr:hypothetical protein F5H01DRAFT_348681 [Linnemannia elongata]